MEACCPSCGTANVAGTAAVNVCTECVAFNTLGLSIPVAGGITAALAVIAVVLVRQWLKRPRSSRQTAVLACLSKPVPWVWPTLGRVSGQS